MNYGAGRDRTMVELYNDRMSINYKLSVCAPLRRLGLLGMDADSDEWLSVFLVVESHRHRYLPPILVQEGGTRESRPEQPLEARYRNTLCYGQFRELALRDDGTGDRNASVKFGRDIVPIRYVRG